MRKGKPPVALRQVASRLHDRLMHVIGENSQAEVARRTGTTAVSVGRYVRGARMPAEFCHALVREFDLNPHWFLMGEGAPRMAEISAGDARMAGDLLALVEAMGAVSRMRLGALAGHSHRKMLRELNDALIEHDRVRARLNIHSRDILARLLDDLRKALRELQRERADRIVQAAEQVARLCDDPVLTRSFLQLRVRHAQLNHEFEEVIPVVYQLLLTGPIGGQGVDDVTLELVVSLAQSLHAKARTAVAYGLVRATLAICGDHHAKRQGVADLALLRGLLRADLGELREGISDAQDCLPWISKHRRPAARAMLGRLQLLAGLISPTELLQLDTLPQLAAIFALRFSIFQGDREALKATVAACRAKLQPERQDFPAMTCANLYLAARTRPGAALLRRIGGYGPAESGPRETEAHLFEPERCALLLACDRTREAMESMLSAAKIIDRPGENHVSTLSRALHHRNVLRLISKGTTNTELGQLRERAARFFVEHVDSGHGSFASLVEA